MDITLKTGLDIYPKIDTTYNVKQQETYKMKKTVLAVFFYRLFIISVMFLLVCNLSEN